MRKGIIADPLVTSNGPTRQISLRGKYLYPGFHEAHGHLHRWADSLAEIDLSPYRSWAEVLRRIAGQPPGEQGWIVARGWDHTRWPDQALMHKWSLDELFPETPVFLERIDLHAAMVNTAALTRAGIERHSHITGGEIYHDEAGPTGLLVDEAMYRVQQAIPALSEDVLEQRLLAAQAQLFRLGITSFTDALLTEEALDRLLRLQARGLWKLRIFGYLPADAFHLNRWFAGGPRVQGRIHVVGFKAFADGALGSRGAWLKAPYHDADTFGLDLLSQGDFEARSQLLASSDWQLMVHAIGDAACEYVLRSWQRLAPLLKARHRWRVEHLQMLTEEAWQLLTQLPIIPSVQPGHATSDQHWVAERIGPLRLASAYPLAEFARRQCPLPLGTDVPVVHPNPLHTLFAAITRADASAPDGPTIHWDQRLSPSQALLGITYWPAYAVKAEGWLGGFSPGQAADWVAFDRDLLSISPVDLLQAEAWMTAVGGEIVFGAENG